MEIIIIDAHYVTHVGIREILNSVKEHNFVIKKSFTSSKEYLNNSQKNEADLILLGLHIGDIDTFDLITYLRASNTKAKIVLFADIFTQEIILKTINAGANAIISKTVNVKTFVESLKNILLNNSFTCIGIEESLESLEKRKDVLRCEELTKRERQILSLIKEGIKNKEISVILNISLSTVEFHRKNIYFKYEVSNVAELLARVYDLNIA